MHSKNCTFILLLQCAACILSIVMLFSKYASLLYAYYKKIHMKRGTRAKSRNQCINISFSSREVSVIRHRILLDISASVFQYSETFCACTSGVSRVLLEYPRRRGFRALQRLTTLELIISVPALWA